mmetsp:Transcript_2435/g.5225  ORF Transcript_2435/g.5225 Transcript_2435/m.5225 type:complete len:241 (+) Transcript_2435:816-1538(+)
MLVTSTSLMLLMMSPGLHPPSAASQHFHTDRTTAPETHDMDSQVMPVGCLFITTSNSSAGSEAVVNGIETWPLATLSGKESSTSPRAELPLRFTSMSSRLDCPTTALVDSTNGAVGRPNSAAPLGKITGPAPGRSTSDGPLCAKNCGSNTTAPGPFSGQPARLSTTSAGHAGAFFRMLPWPSSAATAASRRSLRENLIRASWPCHSVSLLRSKSAGRQLSESSPARSWQCSHSLPSSTLS